MSYEDHFYALHVNSRYHTEIKHTQKKCITQLTSVHKHDTAKISKCYEIANAIQRCLGKIQTLVKVKSYGQNTEYVGNKCTDKTNKLDIS